MTTAPSPPPTLSFFAASATIPFGGRWSDGLASAERLDLVTGAWVRTPDMALGRRGHTATLLLDGSVLVAGGVNRAEAERYWP